MLLFGIESNITRNYLLEVKHCLPPVTVQNIEHPDDELLTAKKKKNELGA